MLVTVKDMKMVRQGFHPTKGLHVTIPFAAERIKRQVPNECWPQVLCGRDCGDGGQGAPNRRTHELRLKPGRKGHSGQREWHTKGEGENKLAVWRSHSSQTVSSVT